MKRDKRLPLTETVFYILLSLLEPAHGYLIIQRIEELSNLQLRLPAGTMYGALENLQKINLIELIESDDPRRKVYKLTDEGIKILHLEIERLEYLLDIANKAFNSYK